MQLPDVAVPFFSALHPRSQTIDDLVLHVVVWCLMQLLDVADNLERAIASAKEAEGAGGGDSSHDVLLQGVEMTSNEASDTYIEDLVWI